MIGHLNSWLNFAGVIHENHKNPDLMYILKNLKNLNNFIDKMVINSIRRSLDPCAEKFIINKKNELIFKDKKLTQEKKVKLYITRFIVYCYTNSSSMDLSSIPQESQKYIIENILAMCTTYSNELYKLVDLSKANNGKQIYLKLTESVGQKIGTQIKQFIDMIFGKNINITTYKRTLNNILWDIVDTHDYESIFEYESSSSDSNYSSSENSSNDSDNEESSSESSSDDSNNATNNNSLSNSSSDSSCDSDTSTTPIPPKDKPKDKPEDSDNIDGNISDIKNCNIQRPLQLRTRLVKRKLYSSNVSKTKRKK